MEYTKLGRTGLDVSRICLGCMSYGGGNLGNHAWSLPEEVAQLGFPAERIKRILAMMTVFSDPISDGDRRDAAALHDTGNGYL